MLDLAVLLQTSPLTHEKHFYLLRTNQFCEVFGAISKRIVVYLFGAIFVQLAFTKKILDTEVGLIAPELPILKRHDDLVGLKKH